MQFSLEICTGSGLPTDLDVAGTASTMQEATLIFARLIQAWEAWEKLGSYERRHEEIPSNQFQFPGGILIHLSNVESLEIYIRDKQTNQLYTPDESGSLELAHWIRYPEEV